MPTLPPGRLTFGQIRDLALRKAGNTALTFDASVWLSQLLYDLYTQYEWPFLHTTAAVSLAGPTFALPADFLKAHDDFALVLSTFAGQATRQLVREVDRAEIDARPLASGSLPALWHADRAAGLGRVWPDPSPQQAAGTLRYKALPVADTTPPDVATPTANDALVPTFPWHMYLVQALTVVVLEFEMDARADTEAAKRDQMLSRIRDVAMPLRSQEPVVPLDPSVFRTPFRGDTPDWW